MLPPFKPTLTPSNHPVVTAQRPLVTTLGFQWLPVGYRITLLYSRRCSKGNPGNPGNPCGEEMCVYRKKNI